MSVRKVALAILLVCYIGESRSAPAPQQQQMQGAGMKRPVSNGPGMKGGQGMLGETAGRVVGEQQTISTPDTEVKQKQSVVGNESSNIAVKQTQGVMTPNLMVGQTEKVLQEAGGELLGDQKQNVVAKS